MVLEKKTLDQLKISPGERIRLSEHDPAWLPEHVRKLPAEARKSLGKQLLKSSVEGLASAQDLLYADDRWSLLVVFQAMDAAGRTAPSNTSCRESIRRVVQSHRSNNQARRT